MKIPTVVYLSFGLTALAAGCQRPAETPLLPRQLPAPTPVAVATPLTVAPPPAIPDVNQKPPPNFLQDGNEAGQYAAFIVSIEKERASADRVAAQKLNRITVNMDGRMTNTFWEGNSENTEQAAQNIQMDVQDVVSEYRATTERMAQQVQKQPVPALCENLKATYIQFLQMSSTRNRDQAAQAVNNEAQRISNAYPQVPSMIVQPTQPLHPSNSVPVQGGQPPALPPSF